MANHGLPKIRGFPPKFVFGCKMRKSARYSHESKETIISSSIPSGTTLDLSANSRTIEVDLMLFKCRYFIVSIVITFITPPKSISIFQTEKLFIKIVTTGIPGSIYFSIVVLVDMRLANFPITWIVVGSFFFLPVFLMHNSFIVLAYIGIYLISFNNGIFT